MRADIYERFLSFVLGEPNSGCWLWMGCVNGKTRYGNFQMKAAVGGKFINALAHRVSWELHYGAIPKGIFVLHKCDTPSCVNPAHLFLGTPADNMADKVSKGRHSHRENHGMAKLSEADVVAIRASKSSYRKIGAQYGISGTHAWRISHGKGWK